MHRAVASHPNNTSRLSTWHVLCVVFYKQCSHLFYETFFTRAQSLALRVTVSAHLLSEVTCHCRVPFSPVLDKAMSIFSSAHHVVCEYWSRRTDARGVFLKFVNHSLLLSRSRLWHRRSRPADFPVQTSTLTHGDIQHPADLSKNSVTHRISAAVRYINPIPIDYAFRPRLRADSPCLR